MQQTCELTGPSYETLKYYRKEGLVPNVARDRANRRVFNERNIGWISDLICLRNCGMGIEEMRGYLGYIDRKDALYQGFLDGSIPYTSNIVDDDHE